MTSSIYFDTFESASQMQISKLQYALSQSEARCAELTEQNEILQSSIPLHIAQAIVEKAKAEKAEEDANQIKNIAANIRALRIRLEKRIESELPETLSAPKSVSPSVLPSVSAPTQIVSAPTQNVSEQCGLFDKKETTFDLMNCPFMEIGSDVLYFHGGDVVHTEKC